MFPRPVFTGTFLSHCQLISQVVSPDGFWRTKSLFLTSQILIHSSDSMCVCMCVCWGEGGGGWGGHCLSLALGHFNWLQVGSVPGGLWAAATHSAVVVQRRSVSSLLTLNNPLYELLQYLYTHVFRKWEKHILNTSWIHDHTDSDLFGLRSGKFGGHAVM